MNELERALVGDSYAAPPAHILEGLDAGLIHRNVAGAPHTIYQELWHIVFWQQVTLDWMGGIETPYPTLPSCGFPAQTDTDRESWDQLCQRFFRGSKQAAAMTREAAKACANDSLSIATRYSATNDVSSRTARKPRSSQRLSSGAHCPAAATLSSMATPIGRL